MKRPFSHHITRYALLLPLLIGMVLSASPPSNARPKGTVYAVLIGVGKYKRFRNRHKRWKNLDYTRRDVKGLYRVLTGPGKVPRQNIKVLYDHRATRKHIIRTLSHWLRKAKAQDTVMVYFSGHGAAGCDGISYWMAHDTPHTSVESGIGHHTLNGILAGCRTRRVVLMVDACQSGSVKGGKGRKGVIDPSAYQSAGRAVIASSRQNQLSYESSKIKHGIFSYVLMQALQGKADVNKDGVVSVIEAYQYLTTHVPKLAKKLENGKQNPAIKFNVSGLIALSFPGTKQKPKPPKGNLKIESVPPGASVSVDGVDMGETPLTLQVTPGIRRIEVTKRGYKPWKSRLYAYRTRLHTKRIRLRRAPNQPTPQPRGTIYAVLIGIETYKHFQDKRKRWTTLPYITRDIEGIRRTLTGAGNIPASNIKIILNKQATKRNIIHALHHWLRKAKAQDTVMVYFSGHGAVGSDGIYYWMAHDTPKTFVSSGISPYLINGLLARLQTRQVVLVIDACQSGNITGAKGIVTLGAYRRSGRAIIASSKANQWSYVATTLKHGIFAYAFIQAFSGKADNDKSGTIDVFELFLFLAKWVPQLAKRHVLAYQNPVLMFTGSHPTILSFPAKRTKKRKRTSQ